jgi:hypothetical protein
MQPLTKEFHARGAASGFALIETNSNSRQTVPAQPVDATPSNRLIGQHFSQGTDLSELFGRD